jgi:hypothetical protein
MKINIFLLLSAFVLLGFVLNDAALSIEQSDSGRSQGNSFSFVSLIRPLGIATLCFVFITVATGLFRRQLRRAFLKVHLLFAIIACLLALAHGILVFVLFG